MQKSIEGMSEMIRNRKQRFRKALHCPGKPEQHRFERRKIRQFIRLSERDEDLNSDD
jgi:hypothetical protein